MNLWFSLLCPDLEFDLFFPFVSSFVAFCLALSYSVGWRARARYWREMRYARVLRAQSACTVQACAHSKASTSL